MKKIIILLVSFVLILVGCTTTYTEHDLIDMGYVINDTGNYELQVTDSGSIIFSSYEDEEGTMPSSVYAQITLHEYQTIVLEYDFIKGEWVSYYYWGYGNERQYLNPNDTYAYIEATAPEVLTELNKFVEHYNLDATTLEGGDKSVAEELMQEAIVISNVVVTESASTIEDLHLGGPVDESDYVVDVKFDITNNTNATIDGYDTNMSICYETSNGEDCRGLISNQPLEYLTLEAGETKTLEFSTNVASDSSNYYARVYIHWDGDDINGNDELIYKSDIVNQ